MASDSINQILKLEPHELARILLDRAGISNNELARDLGVTPAFVSGVIRRYWRSATTEEHIAKRLGTSKELLFPADKPTRKIRRCNPRNPEGKDTMGGRDE